MNSGLLPLAGGILIGISSLIMLALLGRITGISGIFAGAIQGERGLWRWAFLIGLIAAPLLYHGIGSQPAPAPSSAPDNRPRSILTDRGTNGRLPDRGRPFRVSARA